jgi:hypothetical protein
LPIHHVKGTIVRKLFGLIPADRINIVADPDFSPAIAAPAGG